MFGEEERRRGRIVIGSLACAVGVIAIGSFFPNQTPRPEVIHNRGYHEGVSIEHGENQKDRKSSPVKVNENYVPSSTILPEITDVNPAITLIENYDRKLIERPIKVELEAPFYDIPEGMCSRYVRLVAKDLFGKSFASCNAWDRKYKDILVGRVGGRDLNELVDEGIIKPGMVLGVYYPKSIHNLDLDIRGNQVEYTHNMVLLGENKEGDAVFAEQFGRKIRTRTPEQFDENGLVGIEFFDSKH